ncbi:hypothetical protein Tco_0531066 [Tanacetum coccineum]
MRMNASDGYINNREGRENQRHGKIPPPPHLSLNLKNTRAINQTVTNIFNVNITKRTTRAEDINTTKGKVQRIENEAKTGRYGYDIGISTTGVTTASVPVTTASPTRPVDDSITDDITLAETLMKIKSSVSRPQKAKGVVVKEPSEPTTTSRPQPQILAKDKRKGIMQEPEKPVKVKGKDQIAFDEEVAQRLEAQLQAEFEEEERVARQKE